MRHSRTLERYRQLRRRVRSLEDAVAYVLREVADMDPTGPAERLRENKRTVVRELIAALRGRS